MDDGTAYGFAGNRRAEVIDTATKKDVLGNPVDEIPLDVFSVGEVQLTAFGVPADKQTEIFKKWRALPDEQKKAFIAQWENVDPNDQANLNAFLQRMIDSLS